MSQDLLELKAHVAAWIERSDLEMREPLRWQFLSSSKFFRPLTVFACHQAVAGGLERREILSAAMAVELLHNVALIVDDILDRSRLRRGKLTLHCRYGELRALMTAGYVTAAGFKLVAQDPYATRLLAELLQRLGVAECLQWRLRRRPLGVRDWEGIAAEDTGAMFEVCASLGARDGRLRRFGRLLGMLYHGCDDVADVRGAAALGGGGHEDLRDGILTLPAALATRDPRVASMFANPRNGDVRRLRRRLALALPDAEQHLDRIAAAATAEARQNAKDAGALIALVRSTRELSTR
jgi:geranylgeranyl pyrophosphate synthase